VQQESIMSIRGLSSGVALFAVAFFAASATATPPARLNFQGLALTPAGVPIQGNQSVSLRIWSDALSTAPTALLYGEQHASVAFIDGVFQIAIGTGTPTTGPFGPAVFNQSGRWIELQIGAETLVPRKHVDATPFALQAANSDSVAGLAGSGLITGVTAGAGLSGGGTAGDVSLSLAPNGIGATQIIDGSITSVEIANNTITSADIAGNTITGADMAFNSISSALIVDGSIFEHDIANEAGMNFTQNDTPAPLDQSEDILLSVTVDAPSDGFIVASASLTIENTTGPGDVAVCSLTVNSLALDLTATLTQSDDGHGQLAFALTRGFLAPVQGTYVVRLLCQGYDADALIARQRQLTAFFAPTQY
jgi:hypothetical protein